MQKENVIDLLAYRQQLNTENELAPKATTISKDLEAAIQHLILQLREFGPIKM